MSSINQDKIPNNVNLSDDRRLQRALERWQPAYIDWWNEMGPEGFNKTHEIYLRTAISVEADGWAHFDHVRMPDYRWGIFLTPPEKDKKIGFGDFKGQPVWNEVPGEFRNQLRNLVVTQADTEPASVEQQRLLGQTCPSLYDLRNLFQVNVEEGRHLWAMVYLLHSYFGRDGREEAEELLARRSGNEDKPRILGAFNEPCENWLDFFAFTMFIDRDGKYQLMALAESALDPLARTTRFMLTEEAHHLFVGETGVGRIVERSAELGKKHDDVRAAGGIDLDTIQKTINLWYSLGLDLFGSEISSNASNYFANGLKGRANEKRYEDHAALEGFMNVERMEGGKLVNEEVALRKAMNLVLRNDYSDDCERALKRWNKSLETIGVPDQLTLPSRRFHRNQGMFSGSFFDPQGNQIDEATFKARRDDWLPSVDDRSFLANLQASPIFEPGKMASWIAPPKKGVGGMPVDYEYVRTDG